MSNRTRSAKIGRSGRHGWERLSAPGDKLGARWRHTASGWEVKHCGHPTANWPYYAVDPEHPAACTMTHNGRGFLGLAAAFDAIESVLRGEMVATDDRCGPTTRRITTEDDTGPAVAAALRAGRGGLSR